MIPHILQKGNEVSELERLRVIRCRAEASISVFLSQYIFLKLFFGLSLTRVTVKGTDLDAWV